MPREPREGGATHAGGCDKKGVPYTNTKPNHTAHGILPRLNVPGGTVADNSMAKVIGNSPVPNKLYSTVNPQDAQAAYNALLEFKDVVKAAR